MKLFLLVLALFSAASGFHIAPVAPRFATPTRTHFRVAMQEDPTPAPEGETAAAPEAQAPAAPAPEPVVEAGGGMGAMQKNLGIFAALAAILIAGRVGTGGDIF